MLTAIIHLNKELQWVLTRKFRHIEVIGVLQKNDLIGGQADQTRINPRKKKEERDI